MGDVRTPPALDPYDVLCEVVHWQSILHPLPWRIDADWTWEVIASDGYCVAKCDHPDKAKALVELAEHVGAKSQTVGTNERRDVASEQVMRDVADGLRNIRQAVDWNAPPPRSLYAAIRQSEGLLRGALGDPAPDDFCHRGRFTTLKHRPAKAD